MQNEDGWKIGDLSDLQKIAREVFGEISALKCEGSYLVALNGNLGAGKTAFVKSFMENLRRKYNVTSPTFVIAKEYDISKEEELDFDKIVHMDIYRFGENVNLDAVGLREYLNKRNLIFVEWFDLAKDKMPKPNMSLNFEINKDGSRTILKS